MDSLQVQDTFAPYYAGRELSVRRAGRDSRNHDVVRTENRREPSSPEAPRPTERN